jgi:glucokinase
MTDHVALAVDVGGTGIKCGLVDETGVIRHTERHPTGAARGPEAVVATILDVTAGLASAADRLGLDPVCAGVVVPAVVADGVALFSANLGLRDVPLRDLLVKRLGRPAVLGHDVRAAALAEARLGAGRVSRRLLFVALGTGIAGGFVLDGRVDDGAHGAAGEIGHIVVRTGPQARPCGCGGRGCLETYASAAGVARAYAAATSTSTAASTSAIGDPYLHADANTGPVLAPTSGREVAELVASGDPAANAVWCEAVEALADGLLTGIALYDPAVVAIGGGLAEAGELLLAPLREALVQRRTFHQLPNVVRAELGDEAGVYGAALLAWDSYEESR